MCANRGPSGARADLDQVAQLIDDPQSEAADAHRPAATAGEGIGDVALVLDLEDQLSGRRPEPQSPVRGSVLDRVRGELVDGCHDARDAIAVEPRSRSLLGHPRPEPPEVIDLELLGYRVGRRTGQRQVTARRQPAVRLGRACRELAVTDDAGMRVLGVEQHLVVQLLEVVRAQHPDLSVWPGHVDECLMARCLPDLLG